MDFYGKNFGAAGNVNIGTQINQFAAEKDALPNTIPSIAGFVGREEYLKELREAYQSGTRCFVLHGIGGVGKTALALQFAGEIAGDFEAKILVEMQGMSEKPYSGREAMFDIVRQFKPQIPVEIPDAQLKSLYIQIVQNQKTLIVSDNAADKQSVETLKQANACFIMTSRESFALTGGKSLVIRKMLPEDARQLLFEIADENRFEGRADELAELAGYLPMALKPLASILAEDELETAVHLIERYSSKKELLKERVPDYDDLTIEASFELSYEKLSDELKQSWRRLAVFPADFDEIAIEKVLDISQDKAHETQKQLRRYNLLEVNPETKRFNLHDLARAFTDEKLSADERFQTQFRHARLYLELLQFTKEIRDNDPQNGFMTALRVMDSEWNNITSGQKWTAENTEKNDEIGVLCCRYSVDDLIPLRLHPQEYIFWLTLALKVAVKINHKILEANISQNLGNAYEQLGDYRKAIEYYEQALNIARDVSHRKGEGQCLGNLGIAYSNLGDYQKAIEYHEQALTISREIGDRLIESNALTNISVVYQILGNYQKAIGYQEESLAIDREIGNRPGVAKSLNNLGIAYDILGDYQKAIDYQEEALAIKREIGDRSAEGSSLANLGIAYRHLGDNQKAIECYEESVAISREFGDLSGEGSSLTNLGNVYYRLGEKERACVLWHEALAILESIESPDANGLRDAIRDFCGN
jgi:tetratricopeptide (TPR) repeat protein